MKIVRTIKSFLNRRKINELGTLRISSPAKVDLSRISVKKGSVLEVSAGSIVEAQIDFEHDNGQVYIGRGTFVGNCHLVCSKGIFIENNVLIAWGCTIVDHNSHSIRYSFRENDVRDWFKENKDWTNVVREEVRIQNKVWIGFNVIILKGVTVGEGAIVGAGSVVTKDVPPWTVVAGNPAIVIRHIPEDER